MPATIFLSNGKRIGVLTTLTLEQSGGVQSPFVVPDYKGAERSEEVFDG